VVTVVKVYALTAAVDEDSSLLGGDTVLLGKWFLMLQTVPLSSHYSR